MNKEDMMADRGSICILIKILEQLLLEVHQRMPWSNEVDLLI